MHIRTSHGLTDVGRKRKSNEDAYFVDDSLGLYVVADGMGGHAAGEVASEQAVDSVYSMVKRGLPELRGKQWASRAEYVRALCRLMESAAQAATYMVHVIASMDREKSGMGSTLSALLIDDGLAVTAQVGDSRIYRARRGQVEQLTEDHTLLAWQVKHGLVSVADSKKMPNNVITRAVGSKDYVEVDTRLVDVGSGDAFLVCSDGLHGYVDKSDEIAAALAMPPMEASIQLVRWANERGGRDNITAVVVRVMDDLEATRGAGST